MPSTILDVARLSGFSKTTVSRAFVNPEHVQEETRLRIYEAAKTLNYTPNAIARAMVRKKTDNLAFIIYEQQYPVVLNPFYSPIFEAVLQTAAKRGYSLFVSSDKDVRLPSGELYMKKQMDGVIIAGKTDTDTVMSLMRQHIPVVLLNNALDIEGLPSVTTDHYGGAVQAMEHLFERGHRKIGLIAGRFSPHPYNMRFKAYTDALKRHGCEIDHRFLKTIEPTLDDSMHCVASLLAMQDRPTALFCTNDTIAVGAIKAALRIGLRVPQDIAVVGFDDSYICRIMEPELTSVRVDTEKMGRAAADALIALIDGQPDKAHNITVKTQLIVRQST